MTLKNTQDSWGTIAMTIHWVTAFTVIGLFALGLWMVELTYYDDWYKQAPFIHKSIGILLFLLTAFRLIWRTNNTTPTSLATHKDWEKRLAHITHVLLYALLFCLMISGYLISTADGRSVSVFGWFEIPAFIYGIEHQEDIAGEIHFYIAVILVSLASMHAAAALKHHFIDKDKTLKHMLGLK